jgi:hypothetical protein
MAEAGQKNLLPPFFSYEIYFPMRHGEWSISEVESIKRVHSFHGSTGLTMFQSWIIFKMIERNYGKRNGENF